MGFLESGFSQLLLFIGFAAGLASPMGVPPGQEDPAMAKVAPQQCVFYTSWAGTGQPNAQSPNHTEQLLADPQVQQSLQRWNHLVATALTNVGSVRGQEAADAAKDAEEIGKAIMSHPGAVFIASARQTPQGFDVQGGALSNLGNDAGRIRGLIDKHRDAFFGQNVQQANQGNDTWYHIRRPDGRMVSVGFHDQYLIFGIGNGSGEGIVQRMGNNPPQWLVDVQNRLTVPRRATLTYIQFGGIRDFLASWMGAADTQQLLNAIGLSNVRFTAIVTGLDQTGFLSRSYTDIEGQPAGLFAVGAQRPLTPDDLAAVPQDVVTAAVARADAGRLWDSAAAIFHAVNPQGFQQFQARLNSIQQRTNLDFRRDVIPALGDTWCLYDTGSKTQPAAQTGSNEAAGQPVPANRPVFGGRPLSGLTLIVPVRDPQRLERVRAQLMQAFQNPQAGQQALSIQLNLSQVNGRQVTQIRFGDQPTSPSLAWSLTDRALIVSPSLENVRAQLTRTPQSPSLANVRDVAEVFQAGGAPVAIAYQDAQRAFDQVYPRLEAIAGLFNVRIEGNGQAGPLLPPADAIRKHLQPTVAAIRWSRAGLDSFVHQTLPGVNAGVSGPIVLGVMLRGQQLSGNVAQRDASMQNLRQISAAVLQYQKTHNRFPSAAITDAQGHPLLSWRVAILPMLGQEELYKQFHLNEAWDSPHNRQLVARMPEVFHAPLSKAEQGRTNYLAVIGDNTVFSSQPPIDLARLGQRAGQTILLVEANDRSAAFWTQPAEFQFNPAAPTQGLRGIELNGFLAAMADGSVRFISDQTDPQALTAMFTLAGQAPLTARRPGQPQPNGQQQTPQEPVGPPVRR